MFAFRVELYYKCRYILATLSISAILLMFLPQSNDIMLTLFNLTLDDMKLIILNYISIYIIILAWSIQTFFAARYQLLFTKIENSKLEPNQINNQIKITARIFGIIPIIIFMLSCLFVYYRTNSMPINYLLINIICCVVVICIYWRFVVIRLKIWEATKNRNLFYIITYFIKNFFSRKFNINSNETYFDNSTYETVGDYVRSKFHTTAEKKRLMSWFQNYTTSQILFNIIIPFFLFGLFCSTITEYIKALPISLWFLCSIMFIITSIRIWLPLWGRLLFLVYCIMSFILTDRYLTNHIIKEHTFAENNYRLIKRPELREYLDRFLKTRIDTLLSNKPFPLFIITAEGGASRSAYWTGLVLSKLQDTTNSEFAKHILAISSVSGGTMGSAVFTACLAQKGAGTINLDPDKRINNPALEILKQDYLSATFARWVFTEPIYRLVVIPSFILLKYLGYPELINNCLSKHTDRASIMEKAWENNFQKITTNDHFSNSFLSLWQNITLPNTMSCLPILLINTTRVHDGKRVIISNVKLNQVHKHFSDIDTLSDQTLSKINFSSAAFLSARFPFVSPSGIIKSENMALVDGGYFDNSGSATALEFYNAVKEIQMGMKANDPYYKFYKKFDLYVISITNDQVESQDTIRRCFKEQTNHSLQFESIVPATTAINSLLGAHSIRCSLDLKNQIRDHKYFNFNLDTPMNIVTLNWYLSKDALDMANNQLKRYDSTTVKGIQSVIEMK